MLPLTDKETNGHAPLHNRHVFHKCDHSLHQTEQFFKSAWQIRPSVCELINLALGSCKRLLLSRPALLLHKSTQLLKITVELATNYSVVVIVVHYFDILIHIKIRSRDVPWHEHQRTNTFVIRWSLTLSSREEMEVETIEGVPAWQVEKQRNCARSASHAASWLGTATVA